MFMPVNKKGRGKGRDGSVMGLLVSQVLRWRSQTHPPHVAYTPPTSRPPGASQAESDPLGAVPCHEGHPANALTTMSSRAFLSP